MGAIRYLLAAALAGALCATAGCAPSVVERGDFGVVPALRGDQFIADDGAILQFRSWLPETPPHAIIVAVHGMNEYSNAFKLPAETWVKQGIGVYALDQRGFGASPDRGIWPGADSLTEDLTSFIRLVKRRHENLPLFLLGESMGGGVAALTAGRVEGLPIAGVILVSPAIVPYDDLPVYWRAPLWLLAHTTPWATFTGRGLRLQPTDNIDAWREMSEDKLVIRETRIDAIYGLTQLMDKAAKAVPSLHYPTLLLYGERDDFVRQWMASWVIDNADGRRIDVITYDSGYHWLLRDLESKQVLDDIDAWMARVAPAS